MRDNELKSAVDVALCGYFPDQTATRIHEAMAYSVNLGGKRLRPILVLLSARLYGASTAEAMPMAMAMEMIHTYSLIHDDLPCMDDDDFRRGKPTSHRVFGEALAVLAGDALLNEAVNLLLATYGGKGREAVESILLITRASGKDGMILGQVLDMENERRGADGAALRACHERKTGALIAASLAAPALCFGKSNEEAAVLQKVGTLLGLAFQIQDDLLDATATREDLGKTPGKDAAAGKSTYVSLYGLEESRTLAKSVTEEALALLHTLPRDTADLTTLFQDLLHRKY